MQPQLLIEVLNTINDRVFLKDASGRITFVNRSFLATYGLSEAQVVGRCHDEFLPSKMIEPCRKADKAVLEHGQSVCLETYWQNAETGARHWSETHKSPLLDGHGNVVGIVGISRDISARRQAEEELNRQKTLLEQVVETVPDMIFVKDPQRRIVVANRAFLDMIGQYTDHALDEDPSALLPAELTEFSQQTDSLVLNEGESVHRQITFTDHDGDEKSFEIRKLPLLEEGKITGIVALCRDLSDSQAADRKLKRNESLLLHAARLSSLGELTAGIAHEVNQPLYSILNYAKAIENKLSDEATLDISIIRDWIQKIKREASRGGKITQRLRSFIKPTDTTRKLSEINKLVRESVAFVAMEAQDTGVSIELDLAESLPELLVDRIQLQQVLVNLLKNALEALAEELPEYPQVVVSTRCEPGHVEIAVADNGPGIATAAEVNILDPFQTTKQDGIGLGLAISKSIIDAHQGQLSYHSNEWGGATFRMTLYTVNERSGHGF